MSRSPASEKKPPATTSNAPKMLKENTLQRAWMKLQPYGFQQGLSYCAGKLAFCEISWIKNQLIRTFLKKYPEINLKEAVEQDPFAYRSVMELFARPLKADARPLPKDARIIASPCDGRLMEMGEIHKETLVTAKGHPYTVSALLGSKTAASLFEGGTHATFYLAPIDYHRVHMPTHGRVEEMTYIPGNLFSVQPKVLESIPDLFTRNTRVAVLFETPFGPLALVFVAAFLVSGVHIRWAGSLASTRKKTWQYPKTADTHIRLQQGEECGYFYFGSTVVMLLPAGAHLSKDLSIGTHYKMGAKLGTFK